jgi:hypothetical protein
MSVDEIVDKLAENQLKVLRLERELDEGDNALLDGLQSHLAELDLDTYCLLNDLVEAYYKTPI